MREIIAREIFAQACRNLRIRLKRNHASLGPHQARSDQRKVSDIRTEIIKRHAWPKMIHQRLLDLRLADPPLDVLPRARIDAYPKASRGAVLNLNPDEGIAREKLAAGPTEEIADDGNAAQFSEGRSIAQEKVRETVARFPHFISPQGSCREPGRPCRS